MKNYKILVNGKMISKKEKLNIFSPINLDVMGTVPALSRKDIDLIYKESEKSFNEWSQLEPKVRIKYIEAIKKNLIKMRDEISITMCLEISKPIKACYQEFDRSIEYIDLTIESYKNKFINPNIIDESIHKVKGKDGYFYRVPLGVVLAISPFNYPLNLSLAKIIPALILGNTVVFKPATQGSIVGALLSQAIYESNLPSGVFNTVTGKGSEIGDYLIESEKISMISFTGGVSVGKRIASKKSMIPLVLELGGKDSAIVMKDADIIKAAKEITKGTFDYSGQRCTAIKLVYVDKAISSKFINEVLKNVNELTVGNPIDNTDITPMINESSANWGKKLIDDAIKKGAKLISGGKIDKNILFPTVLSNIKENMMIFDEEQFAPIMPIVIYDDINDVIKKFNNSKFGLQGSIFSRNIKKAHTIAKKLNTGTININRSSSRGPDIFPFLGIKDSGFGVQGIDWALESMSRIKGIIENN